MQLSSIKPGDFIITDADITCVSHGTHEVFIDDGGNLYIHCTEGTHFLDGQEDEDGELIGVAHG